MSENNLQDRDKSNAIETYKYLLKITEDLLVKGGYPREILNKYYSLKEISLLKLKELPPPPIPNENNNNKLILNEENELSFNNQIIPKEVEKVDNYLGSLYSSIKAAKNNLCLIKLQENVEENNGKTLENCNFKFVDINEFFTSNGNEKNLNSVLKSQSEKFVNVFRDFDELTKKILDEFKHSAEYIKDLENHIKEIQNIEKVEEKTVNNNEKEIPDHPSLDYKKLTDNMAILHLENQAYKEKSKVLENQIISNHEQYNEIIIDMQNKNQYLELKYDDILKENLAKDSSQSIISNFEKNFSTILEKFSNIKENFFEQTPTKYTDENLMNFKFLKYLFEKFEDDNMWLIGKLKELTEENTVLTEKMNKFKTLDMANEKLESAENQLKVG